MASDLDSEDRRFCKAFGRRLAELRDQAGLTQAQLGEQIGRSENTVVSIETGRSGTSTYVAARMARALGVTLPDLFDVADQPAQNSEKRRLIRQLVKTMRHDDPQTLRLIARLAEVTHDELEDGSSDRV
ncbi:DNA-binding transcriptional regulator, XRE-family HTH domain [Limimonas halophila]|uniref:DNA-binding transcriptional regulator, XRE-family HTH domain n=1 Tax=Limimonas halophila TaxID=1082479 RepID=A0A1G7PUX3_9PROT|nr:helix-turn-helix domain-containing protein [Limimonas halophila]SDF90051.1 DNA-binding transcriptional regulator, XRE-family HTH domain [Limimonas halophila]